MRQLIKLLFFWIVMFSSSAQAQLEMDFIIPISPPDGGEHIPHGPERPAGGPGGIGDLYFGECGPVSYRCNFLHGDGFNRLMREAQTNHQLSLQSFRSNLNKSMSALDQDLENWRNGSISGNSALAERLRANVETLEDYRLRRIELSEETQRLEDEERERIREMIAKLAAVSPQPDVAGSQSLVYELAEGRMRLDIEYTRERADLVESQVRNFSDYVPERLRLVKASRVATDVAEQALSESDFDKSQFALDFAKGTLDLAVSLTPGVGWARDVYEAVSGVDLMSGEELGTFDRSMAILGAVTGGIGSKVGTGVKMINKGIDAVTDASKVAGSAGDAARATDRAREIIDTAGDVANVKWGTWSDLPKVSSNGTDYAKIGDRRYTRHAVDRMTPTGYGTAAGGTAGRGVPTMVVEATLKNGQKVNSQVMSNGVVRETWRMDTVQVVTENNRELVITVMRVGG
ncbi:MAG: pre-toxin TG domain-containing protein [Oligoflexus sp.]